MTHPTLVLGIDVAKAKFDVTTVRRFDPDTLATT